MIESSRLYRLIIFDAEGTLRRTIVPGQPCPNHPGEWELLPHVVETIAQIPPSTIIAMASNQPCVAAGYLTIEMAYQLLYDLYRAATQEWPGEQQAGILLACPHAVDAGCICRKPCPGLIYDIMRGSNIHTRSAVLYVGDLESDRACAERAGVDFSWATDFFGWTDDHVSQ